MTTVLILINVPASCPFSKTTVITNLEEFCLLHWVMLVFDMGSTLKGKNLLLQEQFFSFKILPLLKREAKIVELLPL